MIILDPVQQIALDRLMTKTHYCLFWDMGVGKTYPVLARLAKFTTSKKILILAPAISVEKMWEKERTTDSFGAFTKHEVTLHSYEWLAHRRMEKKISKYGRPYTKIHQNKTKIDDTYDVVILDEAHRMASNSRTARIVRELCGNASFCYALTGTPAPNEYSDLYTLFNNLNIHPWPEYDYDAFVRYFFIGFNLKLPHTTVYKIQATADDDGIRPNRRAEFFGSLDPYCMFAQKTRTWLLEPTHDIFVPPIITKEYTNALANIYTDIRGEQQTTNTMTGLGMAYRYLNGFQYLMDDTGNNQTIEYFDNPKMSYLLRIITWEFLYHNAIVIYYAFKRDVNTIKIALDNLGIKYTDDIESARTLAKTGKVVYLLQLRRGISINPQDFANIAVFYTYTFSYVDYDQCVGRVDRRGQAAPFVRIYRLLLTNTIETNLILPALERKIRLNNYLKTKDADAAMGKEISGYAK